MASKYRKRFYFEGVRYSVYASTEEEAIEKMTLKKQALKEGKEYRETRLTVSEWAYEAVEIYKTNQSDITRERYVGILKSSVLSEIGNMRLKTVSHLDLQSCLNLQEGKSKAHIDRVWRMITFIFSTAHKNKLILEDPSIDLTRPKGTTNHRRSMTDKEREAFLEATKDDSFVPFLLMYHCGCRPSEALKVNADDISVVEGNTLLHIRGTKTEKSDRYVPIPRDLAEKVHMNKKLNKSRYVKLSNRLRDRMRDIMGGKYKWVEIKPTGKTPYWKKEYIDNPLAKDFTPYCLRHTFCTDLRDKGVDIRDAQYLMGHSTISTTANIYTHSDKSTAIKVAKMSKSDPPK